MDEDEHRRFLKALYSRPKDLDVYADFVTERIGPSFGDWIRGRIKDFRGQPFDVFKLFLHDLPAPGTPWPADLAALHLEDKGIGSGLGKDGLAKVKALVAGLPAGLTALHLGTNGIYMGNNGIGVGEDGVNKVQALAEGLPAGLAALDLGNNGIGQGRDGLAQVQALAARLPAGLAILGLGWNGIGDGKNGLAQVQALAAGLPAGLAALHLGTNGIGEGRDVPAKRQAIAQARCVELRNLRLDQYISAEQFFQALDSAYERTIGDGTLPSLFSLEGVRTADGKEHPLPLAIEQLRRRAKDSWDKAHPIVKKTGVGR